MAYNEDVIVINIQERGFKDIINKIDTIPTLLNQSWAKAQGVLNKGMESRMSQLIAQTGKKYDNYWKNINEEMRYGLTKLSSSEFKGLQADDKLINVQGLQKATSEIDAAIITSVKTQQTALKGLFNSIKERYSQIASLPKAVVDQKAAADVAAVDAAIIESNKNQRAELKGLVEDLKDRTAAEQKAAAASKKATSDQERGYKQLRNALLQFNLSIMFFGMQMKRTFQGIAQSSLTTFNKLNADTEAANNTANRLSAGMEGLYYVIGDAVNSALETMEPLLSNILQYIIDFVDQNQSWIGFAIILGIIVGAIMMFIGQLGLLFVGIAALKGGLIATGASATTAGTAVAGAGTAGATGIWSMLAPILAVIALWGFLIALFTGQEWARKLLVTVINVMGKIVVSIVYTFARIIELATGAIYLIGDILLDVVKWAFTGLLNFIIDKINWLIRQANKVPGVNIKEIGKIKQESLGSRVSGSVDFFIDKFVKNSAFDYDKGLAMVDKFTGLVGTGLEVMFGKEKETAETQAQAADTNLAAAQLNYQAAQTQWNTLMAGGGTTSTGGSVTSGMNNGTLQFDWSSVVSGSTA